MSVNLYKIEVFLPEEALDRIMEALTGAHAGEIGDYDHCFTYAAVTGTYRPREGAHPYSGTVGEVMIAKEIKLEANCPEEYLAGAVKAIREAHPYEEPVINVFLLHNGKFGAAQ